MVTAHEKYQVICGNCKFKFAYRKRNACPHCHTVIEKMVKPVFLHYTYYHCGKSKNPECSQKFVRLDALEKQIKTYLSKIQISKEFKEWAIKFVRAFHENEAKFINETIQTRRKAYDDCLLRLTNLVNLKTSSANTDGSQLSDEEYRRQRSALMKEKADLEKTLLDVGQQMDKCLELSEKAFEFACTVQNRFAKGDFKTKKEILSAIGLNLTLKDKILIIEARKPFFLIETSLSIPVAQKKTFEPEIIGLSQGQNVVSGLMCPSVCGNWDDVRTQMSKAKRAAISIYTHFRNEFGLPLQQSGRSGKYTRIDSS